MKDKKSNSKKNFTCERGEVHDGIDLQLLRVHQCIRQSQSTLCIGIDDLQVRNKMANV